MYKFHKVVQKHVNASGRQSSGQDMFSPVRNCLILNE